MPILELSAPPFYWWGDWGSVYRNLWWSVSKVHVLCNCFILPKPAWHFLPDSCFLFPWPFLQSSPPLISLASLEPILISFFNWSFSGELTMASCWDEGFLIGSEPSRPTLSWDMDGKADPKVGTQGSVSSLSAPGTAWLQLWTKDTWVLGVWLFGGCRYVSLRTGFQERGLWSSHSRWLRTCVHRILELFSPTSLPPAPCCFSRAHVLQSPWVWKENGLLFF